MMKAAPLAAAAAAVLACATPALAHAHLKTSTPGDGTSQGAPTAVTLAFTEAVEVAFTGLTLTGPAGSIAGGEASLDPNDAMAVVVPVSAQLAPGTYTVAWHTVGTDGHKVKGSFSFTVTN